MFDVNNYKGVYFGNDSNEQKFYEGGAHFKYRDLYKVLENIALNIPNERRGISEEPKKKSNFKYFENNLNENKSRNIRNIKPLIESLTQKLNEITKDKSNKHYEIKKTYSFLDGNNFNDNNNLINQQSRNFKQYVPNNSKAHIKRNNNSNISNTNININSNNNININLIKEDSVIKNNFDFGKNILQKLSDNNNYNIKGKKLLNKSHIKNKNSRNHFNNNNLDLLKTGTKDIMNKTTNVKNYIPINPVNNYRNHSSSLSRNKNNLEKQKNSFNYTNSSILNNNNLNNNRSSFSSNKSKMSIQKKIMEQKNNLIMNQNSIHKKRQLLMNILKKKNLSYKQLNYNNNDSKSKSNIDIINNNSNYTNNNNNIKPNNNYVEISLLSDLNTPHSKKKNSIKHFSNLNNNNNCNHNLSNNIINQNNITSNNNIIVKPKINISFINNINTITTPLINKSRNKHLGEGITLETLLKKGLLTEIYKTSNSHLNSNKKISNSYIKNKTLKNTNSFNGKINRTPSNKLSRNITSEKKLKNSFTLTEQYLNLQKKANLKYKCIPKNNINFQKFNMNKLSGNNPPRQKYNKSFLK